MNEQYCPIPARPSLNFHLFSHAKIADDLRHLITDIARAGKYIHYEIQTTEAGLSGNINQFGEEQQKLDVLSDEMIRQHLCESRIVHSFVSEEQGEEIVLDENAPYSVVFDPLDGSSLIDANFSIGTIVGIYEGGSVIGKTPREQLAALYILYGPRTLLIYSTGTGTHMFILNDVGEFILLEANLKIDEAAKNYSPGNLRALADNPGYKALMDRWLEEQMTLRYSGCMVADIHHIVVKGQGVFTNLGGGKYPDGKLRHAIECGPFAYIVEHAGGTSSDGKQNLLDKPITAIDQRTQIIIGSTKEVERTVVTLSSTKD